MITRRLYEIQIYRYNEEKDYRSYYHFPHVIFTIPAVACWGQTLQQARFVDPQATEVITPLGVSSRYAIEHPTENGFCIKVFLGEGILIGFHIVGTGATELLSSVTPYVCSSIFE